MAKLTSDSTWKNRYTTAQAQQEKMFKKWQGYYDLMYAHINTSQYALWRSKVFLPIIPAKAWTMISKMQSLQPGWEIGLYGEALNDPDAQDKANKAQWKLEHDWDNPLFDEPMADKLFSPLVDAVVTGTGVAKIPWCYQERVRYEKYQDDETKEIDLTKDTKIKTGTGYNELVPHDIMATYVAPGAKNGYTAPWIILEDWVTYDQLLEENEASGDQIYDKKALAKTEEMKSEADRFSTEKRSRDQVNNGEDPLMADDTVQQFKRLECYERSTGYIYTYAVGDTADGEEQFVLLKSRKNPYWHGKYPLVFFYVKKRPHSVWGQGVFEDTERLQSAFNDLFNHYMDNLNLSLDGMIMKQEGEEYNYIVEPGGEFLYQNQKPEQFKFPEPNANQFNSVMQFIESQIENSTVSDYVGGTPNSATDKTQGTATGIMRLQEAAGDKLASMKSQFANSLREVGRQWLSNNQQFLDRPVTLMGQVESKPAPVTIHPQDLQGDMILRINDASMEPTTKEQRIEQFQAYFQQMMQIQQASVQQAQMTKWATEPVYFDFISLAQDISQAYGQANFEKILLPQDEVNQAMQNSQSPMIMPNERMNIDLNELYGSEAGQWLQRNGIQPDPQRQNQLPAARTNADDVAPQADGANMQDTAMKAQTEAGKQQLEAAKIALQADQQDHQQTMDHADLMLRAHDQVNKQKMEAMNGAKEAAGVGSSGRTGG